MTPERTQAYGRVMHTLVELGPAKLLKDEQDQIRVAADDLVFSTVVVSAAKVLDDVEDLVHRLVLSGRWTEITAARLLLDLKACSPLVEAHV